MSLSLVVGRAEERNDDDDDVGSSEIAGRANQPNDKQDRTISGNDLT